MIPVNKIMFDALTEIAAMNGDPCKRAKRKLQKDTPTLLEQIGALEDHAQGIILKASTCIEKINTDLLQAAQVQHGMIQDPDGPKQGPEPEQEYMDDA